MEREADGLLPRDARILIVEDEIVIALDLEEIFREAGTGAIERCGTLKSALDAVRERKPDIAVLDIHLGRSTTESLVELLVEGDVPFIFYSGHPIPPAILKRSPNAVLVRKPGESLVLVQTVARLLASREKDFAC